MNLAVNKSITATCSAQEWVEGLGSPEGGSTPEAQAENGSHGGFLQAPNLKYPLQCL